MATGKGGNQRAYLALRFVPAIGCGLCYSRLWRENPYSLVVFAYPGVLKYYSIQFCIAVHLLGTIAKENSQLTQSFPFTFPSPEAK